MKRLSLVQMREKQKGKVVEVQGGSLLQHKLMVMGVFPGKEITKLSHFIFKGPVPIKVGRTVIALGHGTSGKIIVEVE